MAGCKSRVLFATSTFVYFYCPLSIYVVNLSLALRNKQLIYILSLAAVIFGFDRLQNEALSVYRFDLLCTAPSKNSASQNNEN